MPTLTRGILISLEGIDGSGKTLLAQSLYQSFLQKNFPVVITKEPGGSLLGKELRSLLQEQTTPISQKAEYLLFAADRAQHMHDVIIPALQEHKLIFSDRMHDSSVVYQGHGRGLDIEMIKTINRWTMNNIYPDLTIYVKIDVHTAQKRRIARGNMNAYDQESIAFFTKLAQGYETELHEKPHVLVVDGTLNPEQLALVTLQKIMIWLELNNLI